MEQLNKAMSISQLCWNMSLLQMDEDEFDEFRRSIIDPMIRRHRQMFPLMLQRSSTTAPLSTLPRRAAAGEAYPGTGPYELCPCNSGRKYKFCCRAKGR